MNKYLKKFFKEIQAWIDDSCPEHPVFKTDTALCGSLMQYICFKYPHTSLETFIEAQQELSSLLQNQFNTSTFPFNYKAIRTFYEELGTHTVYQNPARLAFIRQHSKS